MVLIVEDEAVSRHALAWLLRANGYDTLAVESGECALSFLSDPNIKSHWEIALVDHDLPGMNGLELIRRLREADPAISSVIISATERERMDQSPASSDVPYFRKPVDVSRLLATLDQFAHQTS